MLCCFPLVSSSHRGTAGSCAGVATLVWLWSWRNSVITWKHGARDVLTVVSTSAGMTKTETAILARGRRHPCETGPWILFTGLGFCVGFCLCSAGLCVCRQRPPVLITDYIQGVVSGSLCVCKLVSLLAATSGADNQLQTSLIVAPFIPILRPSHVAEEACVSAYGVGHE